METFFSPHVAVQCVVSMVSSVCPYEPYKHVICTVQLSSAVNWAGLEVNLTPYHEQYLF